MDLKKLVYKTIAAGGYAMPASRRKTLFKGDTRLAKNALEAGNNPRYVAAITAGVVADHRVISVLRRAGPTARDIVLDIETRHGRKLPRSKAELLVSRFLFHLNEKEALARIQRMIDGLVARSQEAARKEVFHA